MVRLSHFENRAQAMPAKKIVNNLNAFSGLDSDMEFEYAMYIAASK